MLESVLPGRIRARLPQGLPDETLGTIRASLDKAAAGSCMEYNPRSGGMLVTWQPGPKRDVAVLKVVEAHMTPEAASAPGPICAGIARVSELANGVIIPWPAMKTVKQGMALSLGAALVALAFKSERAHIWAGGAFAALLSRHLYVYRNRVFK